MTTIDTKNFEGATPQVADQSAVRVLLNARPLSTVFTGVARYTRSLYQAIQQYGGVQVGYFCGGQISDSMPEQSRDALSRYFPEWVRQVARKGRLTIESNRLESSLNKGGYDLYHETGLFPLYTRPSVPKVLTISVPKVLTIYDLSLVTHAHCHPADRVKHFERYFYRRLPTLDHVITISEFIRGEIIDQLNFAPHKVTAIPLAASSVFFRRAERDIGRFLELHHIPSQYILTVGTREPRKNLVGLVRAYARIDTDIPLLCVGWSGWMSGNLFGEIERLGLQGRVKLLGHVPDDELALLYSGARVMIYPSLYEGFGLPILEAMACGCPVICSNRASMPEVAGDAAIFVEPEDETDIVEKLSQVVHDDTLRQRFIKKGYERAKRYSWQDTAARTIDVFRKLVS